MKYAEVWLVDFAPQIGDEINEIRPAVIISPNELGKLGLRLVVPMTSYRIDFQPWHLVCKPNNSNGLDRESLIDCFQIKSISNKRFVRKLGSLSDNKIIELKLMIIRVLNLI